MAWGDDSYGQADVPAGLSGVAAIAAGADFALALKSDGTVVAWGNDDQGQTDLPAGLTGVTQITAGQDFASAIYSGAPAATSVSVSGLSTPRFGGGTGTVTVEVRDGSGRLAYGYRGTIQFTSNDPSATLPSDYTFTGADRGSHVFVVTLATAGTRWLTATDTVTGSLMGSQTGIVVHSPSAPGAPTAVRAMAANGAVFVAWTPPTSTGGRPVTSYRVTSSPGGKTCTTVGTSCRISGLTNEQPYTFTVKATNSAGTGPAATSTTATPTTTTHLGVAVSTNPTVAGAGHSVTVTALDAGGNVATAYRGTVHFTSSDAGAGLPADYTFSATDAGVHKFTNGLALKTAGSQSVTVTDANSRVLGSVSGIVVTPGAMKSFGVALAANPTVAGAVHSVTVKALDAYGNVVPTYTGRIHFTSSDSAAVLPADYTFTAADKGAHKFTNGVTLETSGARLITVTDTVTAAMTGSESVTVTAAAAKTLKVSVAANPYVAGSAHSLTITALDTYGNVATGYRGKIHLTSSDSAAILPADYTFTATDAGVHKFTNGLTLKTAGARSVTATDKSSASITGSATVTVTPGAATTFSVSIAANPFGAGSAHSVTVKAFDACGNVATGYTGTIHFTSSDSAAVLPADYTFTGTDAGSHKFTNGVTLKTTGSQSVTATDTSHSSITGSQTVTVN